MDKAYIPNALDAYALVYGETPSVTAFRLFINNHAEIYSRTNLAGHITGSALVWHRKTNGVLRVHHAKLGRWVFSAGGHTDPGELPWQAAIRELREETGIEAAACFDSKLPIPLIVDAHPIPASARKGEPAHWHYDMVYLFAIDEKPEIEADPAEITNFRWMDVKAVTPENSPLDLTEQMAKYGRFWKG